MDLIDNKDFIVDAIERSAEQELERMHDSSERERSALSTQAETRLKAELDAMRAEQHRMIELARKRSASATELEIKRMRLEAEGRLRAHALTQVHRELFTDNERSRRIATEIVHALRGSDPAPVRIEGPRWLALDGVESSLDDFAVRAHLPDGSYLEVTSAQIIERLEPRIREAVRS